VIWIEALALAVVAGLIGWALRASYVADRKRRKP
jgi:hypothetical protein